MRFGYVIIYCSITHAKARQASIVPGLKTRVNRGFQSFVKLLSPNGQTIRPFIKVYIILRNRKKVQNIELLL